MFALLGHYIRNSRSRHFPFKREAFNPTKMRRESVTELEECGKTLFLFAALSAHQTFALSLLSQPVGKAGPETLELQ